MAIPLSYLIPLDFHWGLLNLREKLTTSPQEGKTEIAHESSIKNLSNIFGVTIENTQSKESPSLRYISPKQIKPATAPTPASGNDASTDGPNDWKVQVAKVVTAYKLLNQENISQGKIGLAVLKNSNDDRLRLILYRSKNNVLSTCTLKDDTTIYRNDLYLQFNDDLQLFWSILFQQQDLDEVLTYIGHLVKLRNVEDIKTESETEALTTDVSATSITKPEENSSDERLRDTKANLLLRMAKMGQPLPKLNAAPVTTTDMSDSSDTEAKVKMISKPIVAIRKPKIQPHLPVVQNGMQMVPASGYTSLVASTSLNPSSLAVTDTQYMNILLAENRTQNSELRMNISKLETKIEKVLDKIDILNSKTGDEKRDNKEDEILVLEEKVLELKKENRSLKLKIQELEENNRVPTTNSVVQEDFTPVAELLTRFDIQSEAASQPIVVYKQLVEGLNSEVTVLSEKLTDAQKSLNSAKSESQNLSSQINDKEKVIVESRSKHEKEIEEINIKLQTMADKNNELSKILHDQSNQTEQTVKEIMNNLYQKLSEQFGRKDAFTSTEVTKMCAHAIKTETNNVIKKKSQIE